jgi:hypothetical protein
MDAIDSLEAKQRYMCVRVCVLASVEDLGAIFFLAQAAALLRHDFGSIYQLLEFPEDCVFMCIHHMCVNMCTRLSIIPYQADITLLGE